MKNLLLVILITGFLQSTFYPQESRNVLVEVFTNSHCPLCPPGHNALLSYNQNSPNAENINYIFYHMLYPYSDDALYQANTSHSQGRDLYYGPFGSTPKAFFDGMIQQNNYSFWSGLLDQRAAAGSPLKIDLTGTKTNGTININAEIVRTGNINENDLTIHFVVVENVFYQGRNGIADHKYVMRSMVTSPTGESFSINVNETKQVQKSINLSSSWIPDSLGAVVFIQSSSSKAVYQSAYISYVELELTGIDRNIDRPKEFSLEQNYPNPFNPLTNFEFLVADPGFVSLKVYNLTGQEVAVLVNEVRQAGTYKITFDGSSFSSGVYLYRLIAGNFVQTRKMILLK
ncbi:MAG: Omp28-related outer membrane protein [Ignavibacteria bacterium]